MTMKFFKRLTLILLAAGLVNLPASMLASAHEAPIRIVVVGEDIDRDSVTRSSEVYKRVVAELQQRLIAENIFVIDEDMIAVRLGFAYTTDRSKQDLIRALNIANTTTDATVRSRLGVVFSIFPNIHTMDFTRKLDVRVRGQIYDLQTLRALSSFEAAAPESVTVPLKESLCNWQCVEEKVGDISVDLAREVGVVLTRKLHLLVEDSGALGTSLAGDPNAGSLAEGSLSGSAEGGVAAGDGLFDSVYTLKFNLMKTSDVLRAVRTMEATMVREIELLKSNQTQRIYSVTTNKDLGDLEERIMFMLLDQGVDIDRLLFKSFGTEITIEQL